MYAKWHFFTFYEFQIPNFLGILMSSSKRPLKITITNHMNRNYYYDHPYLMQVDREKSTYMKPQFSTLAWYMALLKPKITRNVLKDEQVKHETFLIPNWWPQHKDTHTWETIWYWVSNRSTTKLTLFIQQVIKSAQVQTLGRQSGWR